MSKDKNVVPFGRSAEYYFHKAMENKDAGNDLDALELMRKAVNKDKKNELYSMELAFLLNALEQIEQSNEILVRIIKTGGRNASSLMLMSQNALLRGDMDGAKTLLRLIAQYGGRQAYYAELTQRMLDIVRTETERKKAYVNKLFKAAMNMALRRRDECAHQTLLQAYRLDNGNAEIIAELALMELEQYDDVTGAVIRVQQALKIGQPSVRVRSIAAKVFAKRGFNKKSEENMRLAISEASTMSDLVNITMTFGDKGVDKEILALTETLMAEKRYNIDLMHLRAVAICRTGGAREEANAYWARILRLDPNNETAKHWLDCADMPEYDLASTARLSAPDPLEQINVRRDEEKLAEFPLGERRVLRFASDKLSDMLQRDCFDEVYEMWKRFKRNSRTTAQPLINPEATTAVIIKYFVKDIELEKLIDLTRCNPRRLDKYWRILNRNLLRG